MANDEQFITEWEDGWRVRLPLPFQLKWIYAYVLREDEGYTIIDCGLNYEEGRNTWERAFHVLNIEPRQVTRIFVTHYHPDHYGMAGQLQQLTGADVWMTQKTREMALDAWGSKEGNARQLTEFFRFHGLPSEFADAALRNFLQFIEWVSPHPKIHTLAAGDDVLLGGRRYQVLATPGHAEGHVSFYEPSHRLLIGGDILLQKISPNISYYPEGDTNPLQTFMTVLGELKQLDIQKVLPAHGPIIDDVNRRIDELLVHHHERLAQVESLADGSRSAYDICVKLFGTGLSIHNLRFAFAETLAHLEYLRHAGRLTVHGNIYSPLGIG